MTLFRSPSSRVVSSIALASRVKAKRACLAMPQVSLVGMGGALVMIGAEAMTGVSLHLQIGHPGCQMWILGHPGLGVIEDMLKYKSD
jgi:hypothetical protein